MAQPNRKPYNVVRTPHSPYISPACKDLIPVRAPIVKEQGSSARTLGALLYHLDIGNVKLFREVERQYDGQGIIVETLQHLQSKNGPKLSASTQTKVALWHTSASKRYVNVKIGKVKYYDLTSDTVCLHG